MIEACTESRLSNEAFYQTGINDEQFEQLSFISISPNPVKNSASISYTLPKSGNISLEIYNIKGQLIETLVTGHQEAGKHSVIWDADNISSGIYFYRIQTGDFSKTKKCILMKL